MGKRGAVSVTTIPESIRVGHRDFAVEPWPAHLANAGSAYGECDRINQVIRIRDDLPDQFTAEILLHEVVHAAYYVGNILDSDDEERIVSVMGVQLSQVIRDNPDLVAYLQDALRPPVPL